MYIILGIVFIVLIALFSISQYVKQHVLKALKSYGIDKTFVKDGITYQVKLIHVAHGYALIINSPYVIEIKKGKDNALLQVDLHVPTLFIMYPSKERIRLVINENEMTFTKPKDKIYQSYVISMNQIETFLG